MTPFRHLATAALASAAPLALSLALGWSAPLAAQAMIQSLEPTDADRLATQMRALAGNPQDIAALATAGELSLKLGDLSGAAALFARADKVDPRNGRIKAGMASVLVRSERPGEALRFYDQAAGYGWTVDHFAADRGLAYDLVGQNERAQRDYRLALARNRDDETVRRYALSLGIAGQRAPALAQLDPLVRRQDRAAWRAQAFVLAMTGDTPGASKIATAMMPAAMNQGLGAFFQRLPTLSPTDRAFAVHFGEIYPTAERLADARLTPALAPLASEPVVAPVQVAAAAATQQPDRRSRRERERERRRETQAAQAAAPVVRMAPAREVVQAVPGRTALPTTGVATVPTAPGYPIATVAVSPTTAPQAMRETDVRVASTPTGIVPVSPAARTVAALPPRPAAALPTTPAPITPAPITPITAAPVTLAATMPTPTPAPSVSVARAPVVTATFAPTTGAVTQPASPAASPPPAQIATTTVAPVQSSASTDRADAVLERIVANLSIPAAELGIQPVRPDPAPVPVSVAVERAPTSTAGRRVVAEASAKEARDGAVRRVVAARLTGDAGADEPTAARPHTRAGRRDAAAVETTADQAPARTRSGRRGAPAAAEPAADEAPARTRNVRRGALAKADTIDPTPRSGRALAAADEADDAKPRSRRGARGTDADEAPLDPKAKRAADRKALADKKAAAEKKALAEQAAAEKKAARAHPPRIWVQVAGGANEGDLGKAWNSVKAKTPALAGKSGYATPLRATNRVLTGPFKTDAEARAFVNQLRKQGVSGFSFTSEAGQEVTKLGGK